MPINVFPFDTWRDEDEPDFFQRPSLHDEFMLWLVEQGIDPDSLTQREQAELASQWANVRD